MGQGVRGGGENVAWLKYVQIDRQNRDRQTDKTDRQPADQTHSLAHRQEVQKARGNERATVICLSTFLNGVAFPLPLYFRSVYTLVASIRKKWNVIQNIYKIGKSKSFIFGHLYEYFWHLYFTYYYYFLVRLLCSNLGL